MIMILFQFRYQDLPEVPTAPICVFIHECSDFTIVWGAYVSIVSLRVIAAHKLLE